MSFKIPYSRSNVYNIKQCMHVQYVRYWCTVILVVVSSVRPQLIQYKYCITSYASKLHSNIREQLYHSFLNVTKWFSYQIVFKKPVKIQRKNFLLLAQCSKYGMLIKVGNLKKWFCENITIGNMYQIKLNLLV